jgi:calcineurin-like phosphoesterase family protein
MRLILYETGQSSTVFIDSRLISHARIDTMMLFFTSDTHFRDARVMRIDRRPFRSVADHDAQLIAFWNAAVQDEDEVWHLGDFARGSIEQVTDLLTQLNGRKHLIIGNNDEEAALKAPGWSSIQHYKELVVGPELLILCHYPLRTWNKMGRKSINLHGHSHGKLKPVARQVDVGVDVWGYRPITLETILLRQRLG